jgi:hypothetical protein
MTPPGGMASTPPRPAARSLDDLLAGATSREPLESTDSKSGAVFERVVIGGTSYVVKHFREPDWLADGSRDLSCRSVGLFEDGIYELVADVIDSTVKGVARLGAGGWPAAMLMRDASEDFVAVDAAVDMQSHHAFLTAMAALHARFWERPPATTYMPLALTYEFLSPKQAIVERDRLGDRSDVLRAVTPGWVQVAHEMPRAWAAAVDLLNDCSPLVAALERGPKTFVHGDWKMGNLGRGRDGRVVLVDWDRPMVAPPTVDLAWYVAVNCDRLPESKEETLDFYRESLDALGVPTTVWWHEQVTLALLGAFLQLGWSKTGQPDELAWWCAVAERALRLL